MIKVCIYTTVHRPDDVRVFHREAKSLAMHGYEVVLLAHADVTEEMRDGVLLKAIPRPKNRFFRLLSVFRFAWRAWRENAEVYHFHDIELLPVSVLLKWVTKKIVLYDCHENYPQTAYERVWYPEWLKPLLFRLISRLEPALARRLDAVICVVADQQERFDSHGCRTILLRNLPELENFDHAYANRKTPEPRLIYLGGLSRARGAAVMIEIMAQLRNSHPNISLLCLGPFNEPHVEKEIKVQVKERGLQDQLIYERFIPHERVADYLVHSLIGLIPWQANQQMLKMVFPNKLFEYMACGLPVVGSDLPSLRMLINQAECGFVVPPDDAKAHAAAIGRLLDDEKLRQEMGKRGRLFVQNNYNWQNEVSKLYGLYEELTRADSEV
ncbi:MAG TPA: glycosyltransferase family 4 protein [bacterium]|nr:glycosyltransferase family 4 protein [bacterium]HPG44451.1 glycosyltransferase family 4 protein [bacterium]HPM97009.1 glycosyltransferase family 4 protein [bacterium]